MAPYRKPRGVSEVDYTEGPAELPRLCRLGTYLRPQTLVLAERLIDGTVSHADAGSEEFEPNG